MYLYVLGGQNSKLKKGDWRSGSNTGLGSLKTWSGVLAPLYWPAELSQVMGPLSFSFLTMK